MGIGVGVGTFVLLASSVQVPTPSIDGRWIDSQGNLFRINQAGRSFEISSPGWRFQTADGLQQLDINMAGQIDGVNLKARTEDMALNGRVVEGRARLTLQGRALSKAVDFILSRRMGPAIHFPGRPSRILLQFTRASGLVGTWIPVTVSVATKDGAPVSPTAEILVHLSGMGGRPLPETVKISPQNPSVPAGLVLESKGKVEMTARAPGLPPVKVEQFGCVQGKIQRVQLASTYSQAPANGKEGIEFTLAFLDSTGNVATNGLPKYIGWDSEGVARLRTAADRSGRPQNDVIAANECVVRNELRSERAGKAMVKATAFGSSDSRTFYFIAPMNFSILLIAGLGAITGGFASAMRNYARAVRWSARRWSVWLACAVVGGLALFFAYYYGLLQQLPQFPSGYGFAFFIGLIGGFLGEASLSRVGDLVLPGQHTSKAGA